jgi:hypothetical protein
MKKLLLIILCLPILGLAQWSNYYNLDINHNINKNVNINKDVNVSGTVNTYQHISTIDYGQLALANAEREKNRLMQIQYADERERNINLAVAQDPTKAFDYGQRGSWTVKTWKKKFEDYKWTGFKEFTWGYTVPHKSLFVFAGGGRLENVSSEGVTTEILMYFPVYSKDKLEFVSMEEYDKAAEDWDNTQKYIDSVGEPVRDNYKNYNDYYNAKKEYDKLLENHVWNSRLSPEDFAKNHKSLVGELNKGRDGDIFVHKKDVNKATIFGVKGFVGTLIYEDDYQYTITDNYQSVKLKDNGITFFVKVRTYGDKDEITFQDLEGRRHYLKRLVQKIISTASLSNTKYLH